MKSILSHAKAIRALCIVCITAFTPLYLQAITTTSPDGSVVVTVEKVGSDLQFSMTRSGTPIMEPGQLGLTVDSKEYGKGITSVAEAASGSEDDSYPWRGVKNTAINKCNTKTISVVEPDGNWQVEVKAFNDGAAYRFVIPGSGTRTIAQDELTRWKVPAGSDIWTYRAYDTASYEEVYNATAVENLSTGGGSKWMPLPIVAKLSTDLYLCISESGEYLYPGSISGAMGNREIMPRIKDATNSSFTWDDEIKTPWRTFMVGDLNALVNSDIIHNVAPPVDLSKFKDNTTSWVVPGRSGWTWWSTATPTVSAGTPGMDWDRQKDYVDNAAMLGFEYYLVDEGWEEPEKGWLDAQGKPWAKLKELCDYAATKGVKIMVWRAWQDGAPDNTWPSRVGVETFAQREEFFNNLNTAGAVGAKIDFINSESKERMQFYHDCIEHAAQKGIMINFHGCNKPRGEARTWPNEVSREGIYGMEFEIWRDIPSAWYATVPFTRLLAGHGDFTPTSFNPGRISGTSFSLQLAASIVTTSGGVLCFADNMDIYINSKAFGLIKKIPVAWDETIVLPGSEIGEIAAFARRSGDDWYVGIINGNASNTANFTLDLSFLGTGTYNSAIYKDILTEANDLSHVEGTHTASDSVAVEMRAKGGFVMYLTKGTLPVKKPEFLWEFPQDPVHLTEVAYNPGATVGWTDPIQINKSYDGATLTLNGTTYDNGIGTQADSVIEYNLGGAFSNFTAVVGVDDEVLGEAGGTVIFKVYGDGVELHATSLLTVGNPPETLSIDVTGVQTLRLEALKGDGSANFDHADWADAKVYKSASGVQAAAPTDLTLSSDLVSQQANNGTVIGNFTATDPNPADTFSFSLLNDAGGRFEINANTGALSIKNSALIDYNTNRSHEIEVQVSDNTARSYNETFTIHVVTGALTKNYLGTDITWDSATTTVSTQWGNIYTDRANEGGTITLDGIAYPKGIAAHANSEIVFSLNGAYNQLLTTIGLDDTALANGSSTFTVEGDGVQLYQSGVITGATPSEALNINISGVNELKLIVDGGAGIDHDHATWADAHVIATAPSDYDAWKALQGFAPGADSLTSDPDGDGLNNLVEYALNTEPGSQQATPALELTSKNGSQFTYRHPLNKTASDVTVELQGIEDLTQTNWVTLSTSDGGSKDYNTQWREYTHNSSNTNKYFLRVKVTK